MHPSLEKLPISFHILNDSIHLWFDSTYVDSAQKRHPSSAEWNNLERLSRLLQHKVKEHWPGAWGSFKVQDSQEPRRTELLRREDGFEVWHLKASQHGTPCVSWFAANIDTQSPNKDTQQKNIENL